MLVPKSCHDLVPVSRVPEHGRCDPAATGTREDAGSRVVTNRIEAPFDQRTELFNQWDGAGPLALGALVDEPAGAWCCLPPGCRLRLSWSRTGSDGCSTAPGLIDGFLAKTGLDLAAS